MMSNAYFQRLNRALAVLGLALSASIAQATTELEVPPFSATYTVRYGVLSGRMTLELRHLEDSYWYETSLRPKGVASWLRRGEIRETTTMALSDAGPRPLDYLNRDTVARPHRLASYMFDLESGRVTGEYKERAVDEPMRAGGHNRISAHVAIMHALKSGEEISAFSVFDRARWRDFELEIIPDQFAETPYGDFETVEIRYASTDKDKSWSLHCAPDLNYAPVMIVFRENGKTKSRAQLTDFYSRAE